MLAQAHLTWALLAVGVALWALPLDREPVPSPAPLTAFAAVRALAEAAVAALCAGRFLVTIRSDVPLLPILAMS